MQDPQGWYDLRLARDGVGAQQEAVLRREGREEAVVHAGNAGVVDQHIDPLLLAVDGADPGADHFLVGDVDGRSLVARLAALLERSSAGGHVGAALAEMSYQVGADPAACAGDQHGLTGEVTLH